MTQEQFNELAKRHPEPELAAWLEAYQSGVGRTGDEELLEIITAHPQILTQNLAQFRKRREEAERRMAADKLKAAERAIAEREQAARRAEQERIEAERRAEYRRQEDARRITRREAQLQAMIPCGFHNISPEASPRPAQCRYVLDEFGEHNNGEGWFEIQGTCGLLLHGKSATGKTGACWLLFAKWWREDPDSDPLFVRTVDLTNRSKAKHLSADHRNKFDQLFERMLTTELLILDDLGTEKLSESTEEVFYRLFNNRFDHLLTTIISANDNAAGISRLFSKKNQAKIKRRLDQFLVPVNFDTKATPNDAEREDAS